MSRTYRRGDMVSFSGSAYIALRSNSGSQPDTHPDDWALFVAKGDPGSGGGLPDPGSNGLVARTGSGADAARSLTAGSGKVSVSNADGVSGNPTVDLGSVAASDLSNGVSGSGSIVLASSPTIVTPTVASFANAGHNHQDAAGGGQIAEAALTLSDVTTANVTTLKHGFAPKLPNDATKYLDGTGAFTVPAGGGGGGSSSWTPVAPTYPVASQFDTPTTTGSGATFTDSGAGFSMYAPVNASVLSFRTGGLSTPWNIEAGFLLQVPIVNFATVGVYLRAGSAGAAIIWCLQANSGAKLIVQQQTSGLVFSSNASSNLLLQTFSPFIIFRIRDDGSNRYYELSFDGSLFNTIYTEARTTWAAIDRGGFLVSGSASSTWASCARMVHYKEY